MKIRITIPGAGLDHVYIGELGHHQSIQSIDELRTGLVDGISWVKITGSGGPFLLNLNKASVIEVESTEHPSFVEG